MIFGILIMTPTGSRNAAGLPTVRGHAEYIKGINPGNRCEKKNKI